MSFAPLEDCDEADYRHCFLRRGSECQYVWLPRQFAVEGRTVKLKDDSGQWQDGWIVAIVFKSLASGSQLDALRKDRQRLS